MATHDLARRAVPKAQPASAAGGPRIFCRGITLIETLLVLAISAILLSAALPNWAQFLHTRRLERVAGELLADLQWVRTEAVMRNTPLRISFQSPAFGDCYVVHGGPANSCTCRADNTAQCDAGSPLLKTVQLQAAGTERVQLRSNASNLLFDPSHGTSTPTGTLRVVSPDGREVRHNVNVMGRVRSCSPAEAASHAAGHVNC
jgi:type IV fimbrial biogenesis protein FimT